MDCSFEHAKRADLCLAMGSSLTVTPAADIPEVNGIQSVPFISIHLIDNRQEKRTGDSEPTEDTTGPPSCHEDQWEV